MSYASPTEGLVQFGTTGALTVKGRPVALDSGKRYDNPWALVPFGAQQITIVDTAGDLKLDFATSSRTASSTPEHAGRATTPRPRPPAQRHGCEPARPPPARRARDDGR